MTLRKLMRGRALYTEKDKIWIAQGMSFFAVDYSGNRTTKKYYIGGVKEKILALNRLTRQLTRQGIHHLIPLKNGSIFLTTKQKSYVIDQEGRIISTFSGYRGNKPGHQGVCITPNGYLFFGEYTLNSQRDHDTCLYRSIDHGKTFQVVLTLRKDCVRHIHFVKWDPFAECLWMGTGDEDFENLLMLSRDYGETWEIIGKGSQDWRAIGICFEKDYIIWGTDAGSVPDQNHIIRMNRKTYQYEIIANAEGPCHGCASFVDGKVYISTGVEGGENEKDRIARLKKVDADKVDNIVQFSKDIWPLILQYGVIRFPLSTENIDKCIFTTFGLKGNGECVYIEQ